MKKVKKHIQNVRIKVHGWKPHHKVLCIYSIANIIFGLLFFFQTSVTTAQNNWESHEGPIQITPFHFVFTGYECGYITGEMDFHELLGTNLLYSRFGDNYRTESSYSEYSDKVNHKIGKLVVSNFDGNSASRDIAFIRSDKELQLGNSTYNFAGKVSNSTAINIIRSFNPQAGSCETIDWNIISCSDSRNKQGDYLYLSTDYNRKGQSGNCTIRFSDGDTTKTGYLYYTNEGICGNGIVESDIGEECDYGSNNGPDNMCSKLCKWNTMKCEIVSDTEYALIGQKFIISVSKTSWSNMSSFDTDGGIIESITGDINSYMIYYSGIGVKEPTFSIQHPVLGTISNCKTKINIESQNLRIKNEVYPKTGNESSNITFSITFGNDTETSQNVLVTDELSSYFSGEINNFPKIGDSIVLFSGQLGPHSNKTISIHGNENRLGTFKNKASIRNTSLGYSHDSEIDYTIVGNPDFDLNIRFLDKNIKIGDTYKYIIKYKEKTDTNTGYDINIYTQFGYDKNYTGKFLGEKNILLSGITINPGQGGSISGTGILDDKHLCIQATLDNGKNIQYKTDCIDSTTKGNEKELNDFEWYLPGDQDTIMINGFTRELNNAYNFAKEYGITSAKEIKNANMYGDITRAELSKMISNFAKNVLDISIETGKKVFPDVPNWLDKQYDYGISNAYSLGLMGIGIDKFYPSGIVTRAEFGTILSRLLNKDDYEYLSRLNTQSPYYEGHLNFLKKNGIMNNISNPTTTTEKRGYVMLMLMRVFEKGL